jgi:hypothetical protein
VATQPLNAEAPRRQNGHPGEVLLAHNLPSEAIPHLLASAAQEPEKFNHHVNLCIAYRKLGQYEEARQHILMATRMNPQSWHVYHAWGQLLDELGKFQEALEFRKRAWELCQHGSPEAAFAVAWSLLRFGQWRMAWPFFEAGRYLRSWSPPPGLPVWGGEDIRGKRLMVMAEGGYGDTFMFARWLPNLRGSGVDVTLYVWDKQIELLKTSPELDGIKFLPMTAELDTNQFDLATSIMSLPALMASSPETLPPSITFHVEPSGRNGARRIGLCWAAEEFGTPRKMRSIPAQWIQPLSMIDSEWHSLVPGQRLSWMKPCHGNWLDDARLIKSLDWVVTVDSAVGHLAGCLGVPTILMLPVFSSWQWLIGRADTLWYPSVKLVRATKVDDWAASIAEVSGLLNGA